jgi:3-hydroxyethyl bacteriochlorophyllide a dehydrogenase
MRETRLRIAAEFHDDDLRATAAMVEQGRLSLDGLITHHGTPDAADAAYRTAFGDASCLKMVLDWRA